MNHGLPPLTGPTVIDGTTQPGFAGTPLITLDWLDGGPFYALELRGGSSVVRSLVLTGDPGPAFVAITAGEGNVIAGNYIGTDSTGSRRGLVLGFDSWHFNGIHIATANNTVGGTGAHDRNVIAGVGAGIWLTGTSATDNRIIGNYFGTDSTGTAVLGGRQGVFVTGSSTRTDIGGASAGERNVFATRIGVWLDRTTGNRVLGNYIGTDATGLRSAGSELAVIVDATLTAGPSGMIGGAGPGEGNVIAADRTAITLGGQNCNCVIRGNRIGVGADGTTPLGSGRYAVESTAMQNAILGGTAPGEGNVIAHAFDTAIRATAPLSVRGNSIHSNGMMGIDLEKVGPGGSTAPIPVIDRVSRTGAVITVHGFLAGTPSATYALELFANEQCGAYLHGEGKTFLGSVTSTTAADGNGEFTFTGDAPAGSFITATASSADGKTSEFSRCFTTAGYLQWLEPVERPESAAAAVITIVRREAVDRGTAVRVTTAGGSAVAGVDYAAVDTVVAFAPGETTRTISIPLFDDGAYEGDETILVRLSEPTDGFAIAGQPVTITIEDDDRLTGPSFDVTNTNDAGAGSLRQAMLDANARPGIDLIRFSIGSGPQSIIVSSLLPEITEGLVLDGTTQPGFTGTPLIELRGWDGESLPEGLLISGGPTTVRGLVMNRFNYQIIVARGVGHIIAGNWIGTAADGLSATPPATGFLQRNSFGISIQDAAGVRIGGSGSGDRNVIAGVTFNPLSHVGTGAVAVRGNYLGTDRTGNRSLGGTTSLGIGGTGIAEGNIIGPGQARAVGLYGYGIRFRGNRVGVGADGVTTLAGGGGVEVFGPGTRIGGLAPADSNIIAGKSFGIRLSDTWDVAIEGNRIGTDASGLSALPNDVGIRLDPLETRHAVRFTRIRHNLISGNRTHGVQIEQDVDDTTLTGNLFGVAPDGSTPLGQTGIAIDVLPIAR